MARARDERSFWGELASANLYKRNQGRLSRQLTGMGLGVIVLLGCWTMTQTVVSGEEASLRYGIPAVLAAIGLWATYRIVNYPKFADFLISVEAEMDKVSWADQPYLVRATGVVLGVMCAMGGYLLLCDAVWSWFFKLIKFLRL